MVQMRSRNRDRSLEGPSAGSRELRCDGRCRGTVSQPFPLAGVVHSRQIATPRGGSEKRPNPKKDKALRRRLLHSRQILGVEDPPGGSGGTARKTTPQQAADCTTGRLTRHEGT